MRVVLYSHDTMGMGHMRRNMLIAEALAAPPVNATNLLVMGAQEGHAFAKPPGVDCLTLPALCKDVNGHYSSRSLAISLETVIALRSGILEATMRTFDPDVLIVDGVPRGAVGELDATLKYLRARGRTRCVLGLRDVLDEPTVVSRQWRRAGNFEAIRDYYDAVWVYGDPKIYDMVAECHFSADVAAKLSYTGYLDYHQRLDLSAFSEIPTALLESGDKIALCMLGGGQDGAQLATAFASAEFPAGTTGVVLMGPYLPPEIRTWLRMQARANPHFKAIDFVTDPELLLSCADRVVAMGGYNSVFELLGHEKHVLIVPRVKPRREQLIRATRLRDVGLVEVLHPDDLNASALSEWLARDLGPLPRVRDRIDLNGLQRFPYLLWKLLGHSVPASTLVV